MTKQGLIPILVYGTLRPGGEDTVTVPGTMFSCGGFPGVTLDLEEETGSTFVAERVYVTEEQLERLDGYEGYRENNPEYSHYLRKKVGDDFIYEYNAPQGNRATVPDGDWLKYRGTTSGGAAKSFGIFASTGEEEEEVHA